MKYIKAYIHKCDGKYECILGVNYVLFYYSNWFNSQKFSKHPNNQSIDYNHSSIHN